MNIYDIAKLANVSIATVSRVVNDSPKVSQKTKEKVLAVMRDNEYTPNAFARGLGLGNGGNYLSGYFKYLYGEGSLVSGEQSSRPWI